MCLFVGLSSQKDHINISPIIFYIYFIFTEWASSELCHIRAKPVHNGPTKFALTFLTKFIFYLKLYDEFSKFSSGDASFLLLSASSKLKCLAESSLLTTGTQKLNVALSMGPYVLVFFATVGRGWIAYS